MNQQPYNTLVAKYPQNRLILGDALFMLKYPISFRRAEIINRKVILFETVLDANKWHGIVQFDEKGVIPYLPVGFGKLPILYSDSMIVRV